jgi:predicted nucleic acid-binding protein
VLVDTSVWVDHLRRRNTRLSELLEATQVWTHPFVIGELACGNLSRQAEVLGLLEALPQAPQVDHHQVLKFIDSWRLNGRGLGWIDVHLLASARLAGLPFWTLDKRLSEAARQLSIASVAS